MCNTNVKSGQGGSAAVAQIDGRPVLQPAGNRVATVDTASPLKKSLKKSFSLPATIGNTILNTTTTSSNHDLGDVSNTLPPVPVVKAAKSVVKTLMPKTVAKIPASDKGKKPKKSSNGGNQMIFSLDMFEPGGIAAAQREQAALMQAQRKMRTAHYGRTASFSRLEGKVSTVAPEPVVLSQEEKRCSFITPFSDPLYVAYHDEEWGVPTHDDKLLFELLMLSGVQVGSDWTSILKKRNDIREAFAGFDVEVVAKYAEKQMASVSAEFGLDLGTIRGVVNNACRILEVKRDFGSLDKYVWGFVNNKPLSPNYKYCRKIPVKTSKSESISKDMVRRGFRFVGPTVIHSFMQAAGLTNDHLVSCPRHSLCSVAVTN